MAETDPSTHNVQFPDWQPQFHLALKETDPKQLLKRVMPKRQSSPGSKPSLKAMVDAIRQLRVIQVEKLNYPAWK